MPFNIEKSIASDLETLNSTYRFVHRNPNIIMCEIIDLVTDKVYVTGMARNRPDALKDAVELAKTATKPQTKSGTTKEMSELKEQVDKLKKQLTESQAKKSARIRKTKNNSTLVSSAAQGVTSD
jgi:hypothetical protein